MYKDQSMNAYFQVLSPGLETVVHAPTPVGNRCHASKEGKEDDTEGRLRGQI